MGNMESREVSSSNQTNHPIDAKIQKKIKKTRHSPAVSYINPRRDRWIDEYERLTIKRTDADQETANARNRRIEGYRRDMKEWEKNKAQTNKSQDTRSDSEIFADSGMVGIQKMVEHQARMESAKQASSKAEIPNTPASASDSKDEDIKAIRKFIISMPTEYDKWASTATQVVDTINQPVQDPSSIDNTLATDKDKDEERQEKEHNLLWEQQKNMFGL